MRNMHSLARNVLHAKLHGQPYKLNYAVTYACNAQCTICNTWKIYQTAPEKQKEELTLGEIDAIFENFNLSWISLTGGEPFLRKDLAEITSIVEKRNPHLTLLTIPTNGSLPDTVSHTIDRILEETNIPNIYVTVSLDGEEPLHDQLRGAQGLWKKAKKTYELLDSLENNRFKVLVEFTVSKYNSGHLERALDSFGITDYSKVVVTAAHSSYFYSTNTHDLHTASSADQVAQFSTMRTHTSPENIIASVYIKLLEKYLRNSPFSLQCVSGRSSFFLDPYGYLYPCISMDAPFGNLKESSLHQLLCQETADALRQQITRRECPGCLTPCEAYQTILETFPRALVAAYLT
jgi:MoaA/NifB/PqqE/SkfB family radical SAM enzyme